MRLAVPVLVGALLSGCAVTYYALEPAPPSELNMRRAIELGRQDSLHPEDVVVCLKQPIPIRPYQAVVAQGGGRPPITTTVDHRSFQFIHNPRVEAGRLCGSVKDALNGDRSENGCFGQDDLTAVLLTRSRVGVGDGTVDKDIKCPGER